MLLTLVQDMIVQKDTITNIKKIAIHQGSIMTFDGRLILWRGHTVIDLGENFFGTFYIHDDARVIAQSYEGGFQIIALETASEASFPGFYNYLISQHQKVFYHNAEDNSMYSVDGDGQKTRLNWSVNGYLVSGQYLTISQGADIAYLQNSDGNIIWEYCFSEYYIHLNDADRAQIKNLSYVGKFENALIFVLSNSDILFLDINEGAVVSVIKQGLSGRVMSRKSQYEASFYSLWNDTYRLFDAETKTVRTDVDLNSQFENTLVSGKGVESFYLKEDVMICIFGKTLIGLFDIKACLFKDFYQFDFGDDNRRSVRRDNIEIYENTLYIRDTENVLHILEVQGDKCE